MTDAEQTNVAATPPQAPATRMLVTLGGVSMLAGFLVVMAFQITAPIIAENQRVAIEKAVFDVVPGAVSRKDFVLGENGLKPADEANAGDDANAGETIYAAYDAQGQLKGVALKAEGTGYQDVIRILYGYDPACQCVTGFHILKMAETPGLGDRIGSDPGFQANFERLDGTLNSMGTALAHAIETVKHGTKTEPWQIDAISGATISSNAVGRMINDSGQRMFPLIQRHLSELQKGGR